MAKQRDTGNVINLTETLRKNLSSAGKTAAQLPRQRNKEDRNRPE
jgi:non-homologous end joining protein Ku